MYQIINFKVHGEHDGRLIALEEMSADVPFEIKRIYYIYDVRDGLRRGFHAHKKLKQLIICVRGSCKILLDDTKNRDVIELNSPSIGVYIYQPLWREMYDFTNDCVLLVLASEHYNTEDYLFDYKEYVRYLGAADV
ncbi:MAG: FdtA/QdtA family cupin domain-containing protein [Thiohalomonadaceae bacterium]